MAGRPKGNKKDKPKKTKCPNIDIKASFPQDPKREQTYAQICAKGLELKSYKVDPEELKAKYGKPKEPVKPQWPYTGHPQEDKEMAKWSKEKCIEEVQALMNEMGLDCLPSAKDIETRNSSLKVMIMKYCGGLGNLANMLNVKTWHEHKIEEERAMKASEVKEKVQVHKEITYEAKEKLSEAKEKLAEIEQRRKTFTEQIQERKALQNSQPLPEDPHSNMRHHYDRFRDRIQQLKKDLEEAETHLEGFVFAAEVMGVDL